MPDANKRYQNGLFSFRRYLTEEERKANADLAVGEGIGQRGRGGPNPFYTAEQGSRGFQQWQDSFPGFKVDGAAGAPGRFPAFLANVIEPQLV